MKQPKKVTHPVIVQKLYDVLVWVSPLVAKFPKDKRYTLGNRMESLLIDTLEVLVEASYTRNKINLLHTANTNLEKFRFLTRLAKDLKFIDLRRYGFLSGSIDEVGAMLGGWLKQQAQT